MAGADVAVTDDRLADVLVDYAMLLGRAGTTDIVVMPVARNGRVEEATILVGPASQITLTHNDDESLDEVDLPHVDELLTDLDARIQRLTGVGPSTPDDDLDADPATSFVDFDTFGR